MKTPVFPSVTEVAYRGEDHGDAVFIGGGDHFGIADGTAWLDNGSRAGIGDDVKAVTERNESVRSDDGAFEGQPGVGSFHGGSTRSVHTAHLAGADAQCHAVSAEDDRVRFDELDDFRCEQHVLHLLGSRLFFRDDFQIACNDIHDVGRLDEQAAADAFEVRMYWYWFPVRSATDAGFSCG